MENRIDVGVICDKGSIKKINQDNYLVRQGEDKKNKYGLFIVADGMGGLSSGDEASDMIIEAFENWWDNDLKKILKKRFINKSNRINSSIKNKIHDINKIIVKYSEKEKKKMGSTIVLLFILNDHYLVKSIGDSRLYLVRDNLKQMTEDHSYIAERVRDGSIKPEEAKNHIMKNVLSQCIGVYLDIEIFELSGKIKKDDVFLLCSDGFYNFMDEEKVYNVLNEVKENNDKLCKNAVDELFADVITRKPNDNVSTIVVKVHKDS